jgi:hypothetical protein
METLWQDIRYALRLMARSPGFVAAGVLTLALGIGANSAIFSLVYGVLLRPLPYPNDSRLAMVYMHFSPQNNPRGTMSIADYLDWRAHNHAFEEPSLFTSRTMNLTNTDDPEQLMGAMVTAGFFPRCKSPRSPGVSSRPAKTPQPAHTWSSSPSLSGAAASRLIATPSAGPFPSTACSTPSSA